MTAESIMATTMRPMITLPIDRLAIIVLNDGREVIGSAQMSSIPGFGPMVSARLGVWRDRDQSTGAVTEAPASPCHYERVDCHGLKPIGWKLLPENYVDPWSDQQLATCPRGSAQRTSRCAARPASSSA